MTSDVVDGEYSERGALAVRESRPLAAPQLLDAMRPAERVALMAEISNVVKDVIEKQKWFTLISGKKHIRIEGWTFIGGLGGCSAKTTATQQIEGGYKAHAVVVRVDSGIEVGSAEQVCMKAEPFGKGKTDYALIGMASTRACSRALSTVFRHVVELAGYSATPAEEIIPDAKPPSPSPPLRPSEPSPTDKLLERMVSLGVIPSGTREANMADAKRYCESVGITSNVGIVNRHLDGLKAEEPFLEGEPPQWAEDAIVKRETVKSTDAMRKKAMALFGILGYDDDARHDAYEGICGEGVRSWSDVVKGGHAGKVLDALEVATTAAIVNHDAGEHLSA